MFRELANVGSRQGVPYSSHHTAQVTSAVICEGTVLIQYLSMPFQDIDVTDAIAKQDWQRWRHRQLDDFRRLRGAEWLREVHKPYLGSIAMHDEEGRRREREKRIRPNVANSL